MLQTGGEVKSSETPCSVTENAAGRSLSIMSPTCSSSKDRLGSSDNKDKPSTSGDCKNSCINNHLESVSPKTSDVVITSSTSRSSISIITSATSCAAPPITAVTRSSSDDISGFSACSVNVGGGTSFRFGCLQNTCNVTYKSNLKGGKVEKNISNPWHNTGCDDDSGCASARSVNPGHLFAGLMGPFNGSRSTSIRPHHSLPGSPILQRSNRARISSAREGKLTSHKSMVQAFYKVFQ